MRADHWSDAELDLDGFARDLAGRQNGTCEGSEEKQPEPFLSRFGRLRWQDLDLPGPEHEYIIDGIFTVGDKSVIGGPSRSGKSFLAIHAAMAIARGVPFFGRAVRQGLVIYQAGEGARGIKKRLRAYRQEFNVPHQGIPFELLQARVDLYHPTGDTSALIAEIKAIATEHDLPLLAVFIDTLATATGGADENSGKDMGTVMANIARIEAETGAHVCLVHHLNAAGTKLRGHTSVYANIDQVVFVTRDETTKIRTAILDKQKDDEDGIRFQFELASVRLGFSRDMKLVTSCVCVQVGERTVIAKQEQAKGFTLRKQEAPIIRALLAARRMLGVVAGPEHIALGIAEGTVVVRYQDWRDEYPKHAEPDKDGEKLDIETIRKRFRDNREALVKYGVIGWSTPWMWWTGRAIRGFPETQPADEPRTFEPASPDGMADYGRTDGGWGLE